MSGDPGSPSLSPLLAGMEVPSIGMLATQLNEEDVLSVDADEQWYQEHLRQRAAAQAATIANTFLLLGIHMHQMPQIPAVISEKPKPQQRQSQPPQQPVESIHRKSGRKRKETHKQRDQKEDV